MNERSESPAGRRFLLLGVVALLLVAGLSLLLWNGRGFGFGARTERPTYVPHTDPARAAIAGKVQDDAGHPVGGVRVVWYAERSAMGAAHSYSPEGDAVVTAADGTFRIGDAAPGEGYLTLDEAPQHREGQTGGIALRAGFAATDLALTMHEIPVTRRIVGTLQRVDGTPAAGETVIARQENLFGTWQTLGRTDASGAFDLVAPRAGGDCKLSVGDGIALGTVDVGASGLRLTVPVR